MRTGRSRQGCPRSKTHGDRRVVIVTVESDSGTGVGASRTGWSSEEAEENAVTVAIVVAEVPIANAGADLIVVVITIPPRPKARTCTREGLGREVASEGHVVIEVVVDEPRNASHRARRDGEVAAKNVLARKAIRRGRATVPDVVHREGNRRALLCRDLRRMGHDSRHVRDGSHDPEGGDPDVP